VLWLWVAAPASSSEDWLGVSKGAISLVDADPDLFASVPGESCSRLAAKAIVRTKRLARGPWRFPRSFAPPSLGFLILTGLMLCELDLFDAKGIELLGPGDLVTPLDLTASSIRRSVRWKVLGPTEVAVLDDKATEDLGAVPGVMPELVRRATARSHAAEARLALARIHPLSTRIHVLFWNLADRWGQRRDGEIELDVPLSHQLLADLAAASRPRVSAALGELAQQGYLKQRTPRGPWVVCGPPPASSS
jgi:CRP-like cAMP-binding protein